MKTGKLSSEETRHYFYGFEIEEICGRADTQYHLFNLSQMKAHRLWLPKCVDVRFDTQFLVTEIDTQFIEGKLAKDNRSLKPKKQEQSIFLIVNTGQKLLCFAYNKDKKAGEKRMVIDSDSQLTLIDEETYRHTVGSQQIIKIMFMCNDESI